MIGNTHVTVPGSVPPGRFSSKLLEKRDLSDRYYLLVMSRPPAFDDPGPGTFVHLLVPDGGRFFLRRPFSILGCDEATISLLIVEKGTGTQILRRIPEGTELDFIGPLGSSFPQMPGRTVLAVGGGVGLAPLYFYGTRAVRDDCDRYRLLYGARTRDDLFLDSFEWSVEGIAFATDDGSYGFSGNVVELADEELTRAPADVVFSCGPTPMLEALVELARSRGVPHCVSLENRMACGVGACRSCVVPVSIDGAESYRTVCKDGPVFDAEIIVWNELPRV
ncbi:MAG: dihydroorotate dehydrogenase electron transfer subunit [Candidatus Latescibacterota bacterium]|nr:MAG: dihydroorotate dehydrogenase electron transfer subunit [Candidatus Latescibacterota bacterium]